MRLYAIRVPRRDFVSIFGHICPSLTRSNTLPNFDLHVVPRTVPGNLPSQLEILTSEPDLHLNCTKTPRSNINVIWQILLCPANDDGTSQPHMSMRIFQLIMTLDLQGTSVFPGHHQTTHDMDSACCLAIKRLATQLHLAIGLDYLPNVAPGPDTQKLPRQSNTRHPDNTTYLNKS